MKELIRNIALWVLLTPVLLLSATSANAQCAFQSISYEQTVNGSLSTTDCTDDVSGASYYADYYQFTGTAGDKIAIQMSSTGFDNWLVLWFPSGNYTNNDNGGGGTNARIPATSGYYTLPESGTYLLQTTSYASNKTGSYTLSLAKEAVSGAATMDIVSGWNLLGNSSSTTLNVASAFGDPEKVTTVWKWVPQKANWAFYTPTQTDSGAAYAASKGYDLMTSVAGGEGFWVNAKTSFTVALPTGAAIGSEAFKNMAPGWNLIAAGDNKTPRAFNSAISLTTPAAGVIPTNFTSLWAWDAKLAKWYLYVPSLDQSGGLTSYITSKGYLDFGSMVLAPTAGFWMKAGDGLPKVEITNLPGATSAVVQEQKEATGEVINDKKIVSGEYLVQIKGTASTHGNILLSLPIARSLLPAGWNQASFFPEYFDAATNTWKSTGNFLNYDIATETLSFVVNVVEADLVAAVMLSSSRRHILATTDQTILARSYRVAATGISGNITEKQLAGSNFIIHYYEAKNLNPGAIINAIPVNWNGNDVGFEAPSYIRHLDTALNNIYGKFVLLVDSKGNRVMPVVTTPQHVWVEYLNGDPGDSRIGGPLRISTRNVESVADMNGVVAHELFHVFQGFFLGTFSKIADPLQLSTAQLYGIRWFLEATANYYAAWANNMNDAQKKHLYADKFGIDYLSVPIDTSDDQNQYSVAYILDWMSTNYGNTAIVADILENLNPSSLDPLGSMEDRKSVV